MMSDTGFGEEDMASDDYQAVYDAVRSRIPSVDIGGVVSEAAHRAFDISFTRQILQESFAAAAFAMENAAYEHKRPSAVFRPTLSADGDMWCALLGDDLQIGIAGFGKTPAEAMTAFDLAFLNESTPDAIRLARAESASA
jgi:hypothetical protein